MSNYTIEKLYRHAIRCGEIRIQPECPPSVAKAFDTVLQPLATQFITACVGFLDTKQHALDATRGMGEALTLLAHPYATARAAVMLHTGATVQVPSALSEPATFTELKDAIQRLVALVESHRGQPWADVILDGPLSALAADAVSKLDANAAAQLALEQATTVRTTAYDAFYAPFLAFKEVVRGACGKQSRHYRSINLLTRNAVAPATPGTTTTVKPVAPSPSAPVASAPPVSAPVVSAPVAAPAAAATPANGSAGPAVPSTS